MVRSPFNSRPLMAAALAGVVRDVRARVLVLSYNDESWVSLDDLVEMCRERGHVEVLCFDSARYVGARIGIHNPAGERVGQVGRLRNVEYVLVAGERAEVRRLVAPWRTGRIGVVGELTTRGGPANVGGDRGAHRVRPAARRPREGV